MDTLATFARPYSENAVYKPVEVALILRTSRDQVYAWIRTGRLPSFHVRDGGHTNYVHGKDIARLIDRLKEAAT